MYYHWGCTSIYRRLSYLFRSLINPKMDVLANKQVEHPPRRLFKGGCLNNSVHLRI